MKIDFSSVDICAIIKACGESGVKEFKFSGIYISFIGECLPSIENLVVDPVAAEEQVELNLLKDELWTKEEQLAQMEIENPAEYERLMMQEDLIDKPKAGDEIDAGYNGTQ